MICAVTSRTETRGGMSSSASGPSSRGLLHHLMAGSFAGVAELTLGGNPLSVLIANQISGDPIKVKASLGKGWFNHYYGQSYIYNLTFRVPFLSAIKTGLYIANTQLQRRSPLPLAMQISVQAMTASSFALPFVVVNDWLLANRVNNNIDFRAMLKGGLRPLVQSAKKSFCATWLRESLFIAGPICSAPHLREWMQPKNAKQSYLERLGMTYMASVVTGVAAVFASHTFHVIAITQQSSVAASQGFVKTAQDIVQHHGAKHLLMAGFAPRVARIGLCSGIIVMVLDWFNGG